MILYICYAEKFSTESLSLQYKFIYLEYDKKIKNM